ncbi:MAG TPA: redoxin family protein [Desulfopila sp.]|nr:redoxin family protein [Desulfopila sp.]
MIHRLSCILMVLAFSTLVAACAGRQPQIEMVSGSAEPGKTVQMKGENKNLLGSGIKVGDTLPDTALVDSSTMKPVNLNDYREQVLLLSIVPSVDTKVCEEQTHYLGEEGDSLPESVRRITISRDTPFAHMRFAEEADLKDIDYFSDYKEGAFGRSMGLLMEGPMLLARSVILVDRNGVVRYIQVVPEVTKLPDMERAFAEAAKLTEGS